MLRRLFLAAVTVFLVDFPLFQNWAFMLSSILILSYTLIARPMTNVFFNFMEIINEVFILFSSYMMLLFTDFITDVELRYSIGGYFFNSIVGIAAINLFIVFVMIFFKACKTHQQIRRKR
jgi:hypothetical protein